jgi:hypothetical protein
MPNSTIPISASTQDILIELADQTGRPAAELLDAAVESFRRSLAAVFPISSIRGVNPADVWEAANQADAGQLTSHDDVFSQLRARR